MLGNPGVSNTFTDLSRIVDRESLTVKYQLALPGLSARSNYYADVDASEIQHFQAIASRNKIRHFCTFPPLRIHWT